MILPIFVSLEKIDRVLLEASDDLGASPITTFLKVTFPLSLPGVFVAVLFVFIPTMGEFIAPAVVGGRTGILFGNLIYDFFLKGFRWDVAAAFTVYLLIITFIAVFLLYRRIGFRKLMESL
ncbi:ABC transporter permease [Candidatus Hecatella orcuttiae]|uniref:ABC transporter permease n=1 Tax=Candidatus Hecatella orcuttiae TaxID=1935119 RepID=UPI002867BB35|nr:ABC transporter permease subunit [Candidatus Hecatella orcuttiae]